MKPLLHWNESALECSFTLHHHFIEHSYKHSFEDIGISFIKSFFFKKNRRTFAKLDRYEGFNHLNQVCLHTISKRDLNPLISALRNQRDWNKNLKWRNFFGRVFIISLTILQRGLCDSVWKHVRSYSIKNQQCVKWIPSTTPTLNNCTTTKKKKCSDDQCSLSTFSIEYLYHHFLCGDRGSKDILSADFIVLSAGIDSKFNSISFLQFPVSKYLPMPFTRKYEMKVRIKGICNPIVRKSIHVIFIEFVSQDQ